MKNRKPAHLEYAGGKSPRQLIWEKIRENKQFCLSHLVRSLPGTIDKSTTRTYVRGLLAAGFLVKQSLLIYALAKDNGVEAPRVRRDGTMVESGRKQENMWRTLRTVQHMVSPLELASLASVEGTVVSVGFAVDYLSNLLKAGYLTKHGDKFKLNLTQNTGPRPPIIQRINQVYDQNIGKIMWTAGDIVNE